MVYWQSLPKQKKENAKAKKRGFMIINTQKLKDAIKKHYITRAETITASTLENEKAIDLLVEIGKQSLEIEHLISHVELLQAKFID